jgi:hypothetical protein
MAIIKKKESRLRIVLFLWELVDENIVSNIASLKYGDGISRSVGFV